MEKDCSNCYYGYNTRVECKLPIWKSCDSNLSEWKRIEPPNVPQAEAAAEAYSRCYTLVSDGRK